jgi:hypothetical protein
MDFANIETVYTVMFWSGIAFAGISAIFSGMSDAMGGGHDLDFDADADVDAGGDSFHGHGEVAVSPISPMTVFAFLGGFGGGGMIGLQVLDNQLYSLLIALPTGFLVAFSLFWMMMKLNQGNVSSESKISDTIGIEAEVITPIVEDKLGEIAYIAKGSRLSSPARSLDGRSIGRGSIVKIWRVVGSTYVVKEISPEEAELPEREVD